MGEISVTLSAINEVRLTYKYASHVLSSFSFDRAISIHYIITLP